MVMSGALSMCFISIVMTGSVYLGILTSLKAVWSIQLDLTCLKKPDVSSAESTAIDLVREGYGYCSLAQVNTVYNQTNSKLDLIFVNDFDVTVARAIYYLITPDAYHPPLLVRLSDLAPQCDRVNVSSTFYDFKRGDYPNMISYLNLHINKNNIKRPL